MNNKTRLAYLGIAISALIIGFGIGRSGRPAPVPPAEAVEQDTVPETWTCSMHPQIQQPESGDCPICGMDLIPVTKDFGPDAGPRTLSMSASARALADIATTVVQRTFPQAQIRLVGQLDYDETREKSLTARFPARIDELFVNFTGVRVKSGEHLAKVYSPELLSAQRELLTAHRSDPNSTITRAAREKLRLWDLLPEQIDALISRGEARDHFVLKAPIGGVVAAKNVQEGDYVKTGEPLFRIVDLSELWLYLDAYESDLTWLRYGQDVAFTVETFPGEIFHGRIVFIEPEVDRMTRTVSIRVNVPNPDGRLKPGMFARGIVEVRMGKGGKVYAPEFAGKWISPMHPEIIKDNPGSCDVCGMDLVPAEELGYVKNLDDDAPLIIPTSSVLRTGKRAVVYIEKPETERPTYEGREIVLGPRAGDFFIVDSGLEAGERVVTQGTFKIDSALQIQAKPSMMTMEFPASPLPSLSLSPTLASSLLPAYLELHDALASDNLAAAKTGVEKMMGIIGHTGTLAELIHDMLAVETLDEMRKPYFETLSNAMIATLKIDHSAFEGELFIMHCPMVYDDRGADWLQSSSSLRNPYFGAMMLRCGEMKERIGDGEKGAGQ